MNIWIASHECSGISEAGGVKNVVFSLCKEFASAGQETTLFIPKFGCTTLDNVKDFNEHVIEANVPLCGKTEKVFYSTALSKNERFKIVFIEHPAFESKEAVYTYTANEQLKNPNHKRGTGHEDASFIDTLFSKAVALYAYSIAEKDIPDIIHCHDASTATIPLYVNNCDLLKNKTKTVVTIHNAGPFYHHNFQSIEEAVYFTQFDASHFENCLNDSRPEPFLIAVENGAKLTTVSEYYAKELVNLSYNTETDGLAKIFFEKKIKIEGITNGIDYEMYNPGNKEISLLPFEFEPEKGNLEGKKECRNYFFESLKNYDSSDNKVSFLNGITKYGFVDEPEDCSKACYVCYHGRIASQKGLSVFAKAVPYLLRNFSNLRIVIAGQGEPELENLIINLANEQAGKIVFLNGYNKIAARLCVASSDFLVCPSFFEPCGLEDFIAQIFGTVPVAHKTGGLNKIKYFETGFLYDLNNYEDLIAKLSEAISIKMYKPEIISEMIVKAAENVIKNYQWDTVARNKYLPLFESMI